MSSNWLADEQITIRERSEQAAKDKLLERERTCLRCCDQFTSSWKGNRMCQPCLLAGEYMRVLASDRG